MANNYNELTKNIERYLSKEKNNIDNFFDFVMQICNSTVKNTIMFYSGDIALKDKINIDESVDMVISFLKDTDINLYNLFLDLLYFSKEDVKFSNYNETLKILEFNRKMNFFSELAYLFKKTQYDVGSCVDLYTGRMEIRYLNNIWDSFSILHEFIHKIYFVRDQIDESKSWFLLSETPPVIMEYMFYNYLVSNDIHGDDANNRMALRLSYFKDCSLDIIFKLKLIEYYNKNGSISECDIDKIINDIDNKEVRENLKLYKDSYYIPKFTKKKFDVFRLFMYVLASYIGCLVNDKYDKNKILNISDNISRKIYTEEEFNSILNGLDLNYFIDNDYYKLNDEFILKNDISLVEFDIYNANKVIKMMKNS